MLGKAHKELRRIIVIIFLTALFLSSAALLGNVSEAKTDNANHYSTELPVGEYLIDRSSSALLNTDGVKKVDIGLKQTRVEFSENWLGVKFDVILITEEPWKVGSEANVEVWIIVNDMGDNQRVEFTQLKLRLSLTGVEKTISLKVETDVEGTVYRGKIPLMILDGFRLMKPDSEKSYTLYLDLEGSVTDRLGITWPGLTMELTSVRVYAPPSPVSLSAEFPAKVIIGDEFEVKVKVRNNGEYPIRNVKVKLLLPFGTSVIGPSDWSKSTMGPGEEAVATFKLKAEVVTTTAIDVSLSYETLWGYSIYEFGRSIGSVTITKIPTSLSISVTPSKVTVGEKVLVRGSIQPAMSVLLTLTIIEPDGVTRTLYGTSALNGTFGFEVLLNKKGKYSFTVGFGGDLTYEASKSDEVYAEAEERKGACIIATAAYGSELDPHVQFLRGFRDNIVLKTFAGSKFMDVFNAWYYSFSPSVASFVSSSEPLKSAVRGALYPLIGILHLGILVNSMLSFNSEASVIMTGIAVSALIGLVYFTPPTLLALYMAGRKKGLPRLKPKTLLVPWAVSMLLVAVAELTSSPTLMMIGTGALVLSTIALIVWTIAIKVTARLLEQRAKR